MIHRTMLHFLRANLSAIVPGILLSWCFPTYHLWPLVWVVLIPLFVHTANATPRAAARQFFLAGWIFQTLTLQWLWSNVMWDGGWAVIGQQALCIALALFWAAVGALWAWGRACAPRWFGATALAAFWGCMEWMQANLFSGFGWTALGYTQGPDLIFAQCASIGGVSLLSCIAVAANALLALAWVERAWWRPAAAIAVCAAAHGIGYLLLDTPKEAGTFNAGLFQSNYPQEMKWDWEYADDMVQRAAAHSARLAENERVDLFVWPEALIMSDYQRPGALDPVRELIAKTKAGMLTGTVHVDGAAHADYNSAILMDESGKVVDCYDKIHLAPMGEYVPFEKYIPILASLTPAGGMSAGTAPKVMPFRDRKLGPLICFEVLFAPMAETLRKMGADCLVVVTNLGWFGASNALQQELEIARMRAIETRLPLIQSANSGISGVFDPWGRFTPIGAMILHDGRYYKLRGDVLQPDNVRMRRMVGALPVPAAAQRAIEFGPASFPFFVFAFSVVFLSRAFAGRRAVKKT